MTIPLITSVLLGFIPMLLFSAIVYWLDRYEKEPIKLLVIVFLWGAIFAAASAFLINTIFGAGIYLISGSEAVASTSVSSIIAPIVEEIAKGIAVAAVFIFYHNEFDSILDGIIYGAIVGLGFAATENAYYIFNMGYLVNGWQGIAQLSVIRILLVGWQHPFYTAFIGIGFAICRINKQVVIKALSIPLGLLGAMIAHSIHNTLSPLIASANIPLALIFASQFDWLGWTIMLIFIFVLIKREKNILSDQLSEEVKNNVLSPAMFQALLSKKRQNEIIRLAKKKTGSLAKMYKQYFQLCAELAHKKRQFNELGNEQNNCNIIMSTRISITNLNSEIVEMLAS